MIRSSYAVMAAVLAALGATLPARQATAGPAGPVLHVSSHLAAASRVALDGRAAVTAPGYGSVETPAAPGRHRLTVSGPGGVGYSGVLVLAPGALMRWHGRAYWCVNLLKDRLEPYSRDECREEVTDAG
jgi:hypothetical protein